jgi:Adenylate and Guanylate cyclase catalytic domain/Uncharacterized ACR, COG1993
MGLGLGIGIAHGFATLGTIGFEGRFDYAAIGTVSNVASRLCDEAKPGQILISPRVLTKVENAVKVEPVDQSPAAYAAAPITLYAASGLLIPFNSNSPQARPPVTAPPKVWDAKMNVPKDAMLLRIFFGEQDRFEGSPLYEAIVLKAREMHAS